MAKYVINPNEDNPITIEADDFHTDERNPEFVDFVAHAGSSEVKVLRVRSHDVFQIKRDG